MPCGRWISQRGAAPHGHLFETLDRGIPAPPSVPRAKTEGFCTGGPPPAAAGHDAQASPAHNPGLPLAGQPVRRMRRTPVPGCTRTVSCFGMGRRRTMEDSYPNQSLVNTPPFLRFSQRACDGHTSCLLGFFPFVAVGLAGGTPCPPVAQPHPGLHSYAAAATLSRIEPAQPPGRRSDSTCPRASWRASPKDARRR